MGTQEFLSIGLAVLSPVLATVLGIVGLVLGDWRQRRSDEGRRKVTFDDASMQVAFATEWYAASKKLAADTDADADTDAAAAVRARAWLDEAALRVEQSSPPETVTKPPVTLRRLLLGYPLKHLRAQIYRALFYASLGNLFLDIAEAIDRAIRGVTFDAALDSAIVEVRFSDDLASIALATVAAAVFRYLAVNAEEAGSGSREHLTLSRALLWKRFGRRAARVVRVLFYLSLLGSLTWAVGVGFAFAQDRGSVPLAVCWLLVSLGYTIGFRRWALSLEGDAQYTSRT